MSKKLIRRKQYIEKISPFIGQEIIKVISGQRRVGKSYLLKQLIEEIQSRDANAHIIYIDMELDEFFDLNSFKELSAYVEKKLRAEANNYLFIDEIQEIDQFERSVRSLLNKGSCDIYCSGSNAKMLSGELATLLAGRYIQFTIHSLSYLEFLEFNNLSVDRESLNLYLTLGGMPYQHHLGTDREVVFEYLKSLYSTILLRDVVSRENIRNVPFLENLVNYLADNTGSMLSAQNISKYLKSQKINMPTQTVINYLNALTNAYFVHKVSRAEVNGLKIFEIGEKYYFEDIGLRNCIRGFDFRSDIGKLMENTVYLHLIRNGYTVYVGKFGDREIDFLAKQNGEYHYFQVAYMLHDENTIKREFGNLAMIDDNYPKTVISMDDLPFTNSYKGIKHMHLQQFLTTFT